MIDLWYLEWQKQEKHIELFPIHQWVNYILDSTFKLGEIKFIHIMVHYGLFTWKGINFVIIALQMFFAITINSHNKVLFNM